jgi:hypothetical protein
MPNDSTRWRFAKKRREYLNVDPVQGEFFAPEGFDHALVRESIQNSLDAGRGAGPVRVRFALYEDEKALKPEQYEKYFSGLWEHLEAMPAEFPSPDEPMPFLVVEDFGTFGLEGDPKQSDDVDSKKKNHFYYFWRNIGRSEKSESDRGRWGLGKTTFPAASHINSFVGLTVRESDHRKLLMGQTVAKMHQVKDQSFIGYGGFGEFEQDNFVVPIEDDNFIRQFAADFRLQRTSEPGLSIVIPFFRGDDIDIQHLIRAVVTHYFYPILQGDLVVDFTDGTISETAMAATLDELAEKYRKETESAGDLRKMFDLARWAVTHPDVTVMKAQSEGAQSWGPHLLEDSDLEKLRERYDAGERIALRVPIRIRTKGSTKENTVSEFFLYLERDDGAGKAQRHYIRRGITIPNRDAMRAAGARGLVVINDATLSSVLGDAENPAHTDWNERSTKVKDKYVFAVSTIRFVKSAFDDAVALLSRPPEGVEQDLLKDVFSVELPNDETDSKVKEPVKKRKQGPTTPVILDLKPKPASLALTRVSGGFSVKGTGKVAITGRTLRILAAYNVSRGNPMTRYSPFDFTFNTLGMKHSEGVTPTLLRENRAEFSINSDEFHLEFHGFDAHRDLRVKVNVIGDTSESEGSSAEEEGAAE